MDEDFLKSYKGQSQFLVSNSPVKEKPLRKYKVFFNIDGNFYFGIGPDSITCEINGDNKFIKEIEASSVEEAIFQVKSEQSIEWWGQ